MAILLVTMAYVPGGTTYLLSYGAAYFIPGFAAGGNWGDLLSAIPCLADMAAFIVLSDFPAFLAIFLGVRYLRGTRAPGKGEEPSWESHQLPRNIAMVAVVFGVLQVALFLLCMFTNFEVLALL